jgi:hypothetical protein
MSTPEQNVKERAARLGLTLEERPFDAEAAVEEFVTEGLDHHSRNGRDEAGREALYYGAYRTPESEAWWTAEGRSSFHATRPEVTDQEIDNYACINIRTAWYFKEGPGDLAEALRQNPDQATWVKERARWNYFLADADSHVAWFRPEGKKNRKFAQGSTLNHIVRWLDAYEGEVTA